MRLCVTAFWPIDGVFVPLALAERESDIGGIGRLLEETPEDLPRGNHQGHRRLLAVCPVKATTPRDDLGQ
jgi:hypothetical protein